MDMKSDITSIIHRVLYILLHALYTAYETVKTFYSTFERKCHEFAPVDLSKKPPKIPKHVTVLLPLQTPRVEDLADLILWCMAADVAFVSFYDRNGALKKHQEKLQRAVADKRPSGHVIFHSGRPGNGYKNGFSGRKVHVKLLSKEDGKDEIVNAVKGRLGSGEGLDLERFDGVLREKFEFPDPDLAVVCGCKTLSMNGYPPWQARVTEFLSMDSIDFNSFVELLHRYGKCEQRYGK